jgi:alcohol dehydrogenase
MIINAQPGKSRTATLNFMEQLTFIKPGRLEWRQVPEPRLCRNDDALVRPLVVARCDLDAAILSGMAPFRGEILHLLRNALPRAIGQDALFKKAPFKGPFPFGHESVGVVEDVGDAVVSVRPGNIVVVPFQISCGACPTCQRGMTNSCKQVPERSMYGLGELGGLEWGGHLSDLVRVPFANHMLQKLPDGVDPIAFASLSDNIPDGYRTVGPHLEARPKSRVLVVGGGAHSVGLYAVAFAKALGSSEVVYVDHDEQRLAIAKNAGADVAESSYVRTKHGLFPITVDASANVVGLHSALSAVEPGGVCTSVGIYYEGKTLMPLLSMYGRGVTFITGRVNASVDIQRILSLLDSIQFHPEIITTRLADWKDAAVALLDPSAKVVIRR